jgi:hypothetical protein
VWTKLTVLKNVSVLKLEGVDPNGFNYLTYMSSGYTYNGREREREREREQPVHEFLLPFPRSRAALLTYSYRKLCHLWSTGLGFKTA